MGNITENRTDASIAPADQTHIDNGFTEINLGLDATAKSLTEEERSSLFGMELENDSFAADALEQGLLLNASLAPAIQTAVANLGKDTTLWQQLDKVEKIQLLPLAQRVKDTKRLAAHERYVGALAIYKFIEAGAAAGLPGFQAAFDVLKVRFAAQGRPASPAA